MGSLWWPALTAKRRSSQKTIFDGPQCDIVSYLAIRISLLPMDDRACLSRARPENPPKLSSMHIRQIHHG